MSGAIVQVFARAPVPGQAKTRLIPVLGERGAARVQAALVRDTLAMLTSMGDCPVELWCAPDSDNPFFTGCRDDFAVSLHTQTEGDIGQRMHHALSHGLNRQPHVLLVGSDCPELSPDDIRTALDALRSGKDAVLGPAADGGYYLIGLRRPMPALFADMPWSTEAVRELTCERLAEAGADWSELPVRRDLDRPSDLLHFPWLNPQPAR